MVHLVKREYENTTLHFARLQHVPHALDSHYVQHCAKHVQQHHAVSFHVSLEKHLFFIGNGLRNKKESSSTTFGGKSPSFFRRFFHSPRVQHCVKHVQQHHTVSFNVSLKRQMFLITNVLRNKKETSNTTFAE